MKIVVDTETTGLKYDNGDEILQLSIIDEDGNVLFDNYFKPINKTSWDNADIHGITPEKVKDCKPITDYTAEIQSIFDKATTYIGYNAVFDINFLISAGFKLPGNCRIDDVMLDFAPIFGDWNEKHGNFKWQTLGTCATYYDYDWGKTDAHNSLADCLATLHCYKCINKTK